MTTQTSLSPIMQQYLDMKESAPGAVLLFRLGDFYEAFFDDAKIVSQALDLVLTHRGHDTDDADIPMCGVPWHAAENYFARLVRGGHNVAIAEQMESPDMAKQRGHKQIERKIVRVLTPGTITDENLLSPRESNYLLSLVPAHPSDITVPRFYLAGCDISTGEFFVGDIAPENIADQVARINPAEIIYPESAAEDITIRALRGIYKTTPIYDRFFVRENMDAHARGILGLDAPTANPAVAVLTAYLEQTSRGAPMSFRAPYTLGGGARLLIDSATWHSLEIDAPLSDGGVTLLSIIDKTQTAAGARHLRAYLREPVADINKIIARQNHIAHLINNPEIAAQMRAELSHVSDIGRALSRLSSGRGTPRDLRAALDFMLAIPNIKMIGAQMDADLSARFSRVKSHDDLARDIANAIVDNLPAFFRDGNIIRTGYDAALDAMRDASGGAKKTIAALQSEYITRTQIPTLKIKYNNVFGYFIEVPSARADALFAPDSGFIHRQTLAQNVRFVTAKLSELDNDIRGATDRAAGIEAEIVARIIARVVAESESLLRAADTMADMDVWLSMAACAVEYNWTRPTMTDGTEFNVVGGRHPVVEQILRRHGDVFVKNDCDLSSKKIALITGPNMAGKSTYLRANALIIFLSHIGFFVPATSAEIGVCDQLFSRVGASDNLAAGQSTFMVEMTETANILRRATNKSFIIFDEIGRGTATFDGLAIAAAVLEYINEMQPRTLFATHYHELTDTKFACVQKLTMDVREHSGEIIFMHKIIPGTARSSYGIHVAKMAGMPESVVSRAESILTGLLKTRVKIAATSANTAETDCPPADSLSPLSLF